MNRKYQLLRFDFWRSVDNLIYGNYVREITKNETISAKSSQYAKFKNIDQGPGLSTTQI